MNDTSTIREALLEARRIDPRADGRAWEAEPWDAALAALARLEAVSMYEVIHEWLADNMPRALELCPYKVEWADHAVTTDEETT